MKKIKTVLAGQPNCGKSTIFNLVSGIEQHIANYPGVTVDKKVVFFKYQDYKIQMVDMYGKLVLEKTIVATSELSKEPVSVQTLSDGVYFVRLLNKGAIIKTSRIVVEQSR